MWLKKRPGVFETGRIVYVRVGNIEPNPMQPRRQPDREEIAELAGSIKRYGVLQPLFVRRKDSGYLLVSGERRLRAARLVGLEDVPCLVLEVDETAAAAIALNEKLHRRELDFVEEAVGLDGLIDKLGLSAQETARRVGKTPRFIEDRRRLLELSQELLHVLSREGFTERHARALLRLESGEDREAALEEMAAKQLSGAEAERYIEEMLEKREELKEPDEPPAQPIYVLKDVRLFVNTVVKGMDIMNRSGIRARCGKDETESEIVLTIRIPKLERQGEVGCRG